MTDHRKKRMSMLDSLAAAGAADATPPQASANRALRSARDAVDSHHVWDLEPHLIDDLRTRDRLDPQDVIDLQDAIEENGQTVPILVRRHPSKEGRYLLVYGRRRLEAIRNSDKVQRVRALVATLDDSAAMTAQISENMARRDLSFIERALFAKDLVDQGFGNQTRVAEVLTVTKSSVSMAINIADTIGRDLIQAIGAAHGIGRPRWEALAKRLEETGADREVLARAAYSVHDKALVAHASGQEAPEDASAAAFDLVMAKLAPAPTPTANKPTRSGKESLRFDGVRAGAVKRTTKGLALELDDPQFADWMTRKAPALMAELHARWKSESQT